MKKFLDAEMLFFLKTVPLLLLGFHRCWEKGISNYLLLKDFSSCFPGYNQFHVMMELVLKVFSVLKKKKVSSKLSEMLKI